MHFFLLCVYLAMVIIRPQELFTEITIPILQILLLATLAAWFLSEKRLDKEIQHTYIVLLLFALMLSLVVNGWSGGVVIVIQEFFPVVLLYFIITGTLNTIERLQIFLKTLLFSALFVCLHTIDQYINGVGWTGAPLVSGRVAYFGIFSDPNDMGLLFLFALPVAVYFARINKKIFFKGMYYAMACTCLYSIYLTNSRGTMLAVGVMFFYIIYRLKGAFTTGVIISILVPLVLLIPSRLSEVSSDEESAANRVEAWYEGYQMFISKPLLGVGYKNFTEHHALTAHNSYVLVFSETGLIGFYLWFGIIVLTFFQIRHVFNQLNLISDGAVNVTNENIKLLTNIVFLAYISILFAIFFLSRSYNIFIFILLATVLSTYKIAVNLGVLKYDMHQAHVKLFIYAVMTIVATYIVVRVLL